MNLRLKCPRCRRGVRSVPLMTSATLAVDRKCRHCGTRWRVVARPAGKARTRVGDAHVHVVEWSPLEERS